MEDILMGGFHQGFSQMGIQASCGRPLFKEYNCFVFHMLLHKLFIRAGPIVQFGRPLKGWFAEFLSPVQTNPFSNENRVVLLSFQKDLCPHLSVSPVHTTSYLFWKHFYIVFSIHTRKQHFQKASFSNRSTRRAFSIGTVFIFCVEVWTISVSGVEHLCFQISVDGA